MDRAYARRMHKQRRDQPKAVALHHDMRVEEDFEAAAQRIFRIVRQAELEMPGAPRHFYLDVQGHRNDAGGFDRDALELMRDFVLGWLGKYLTEIHIPLGACRRTAPQCNEIPEILAIKPPADGSDSTFDTRTLAIRPRETTPHPRKSRPSVRMIATYLGLGDDPGCQICWARPIERAHVVPLALGGSNDVRNFALLCKRHHHAAPDIADAEAFWRWIDVATAHAGYERMSRLDSDVVALLHARSNAKPPQPEPTMPTRLDYVVRNELISVWQWQHHEVDEHLTWALLGEADKVLDAATTEHFGVKRKPSTYAWALHVARARLFVGHGVS